MQFTSSLGRGLSVLATVLVPIVGGCQGSLGGPGLDDEDGDGGSGGLYAAGAGGAFGAPGAGAGAGSGATTGAGAGSGATTGAGAGSGATTGAGAGSGATTGAGAGSGATTSSSTSATSSSSTGGGAPDSVAQLCVDTINQHRATIGLGPLSRWTDGEACADSQAQSDGTSGTPHGAFNQCTEQGQNECPGWPGPPDQMIGGCLQMMWDEGPGEDFSQHGHYLNMTNTSFTKVACGFHTFPDGSVWAVQNFRP